PLEGPFPEEEPEPAGPGSSSGNKAGWSRDTAPARPPPSPRGPGATSKDAAEDLTDSLGFGNGPDGAGNAQRTPGGQELRKGRAGIQELLLGRGSAGKAPEQPGGGESLRDPKDRTQPGPAGARDQPDSPFGSYEPSVASGTGRGRRRRIPAGSSSQRPPGAAWLGLKDEDFPG
ncbi:FBF1 factor, partial [Atrichornis clamosus]|nr:FBF1 factor [Atrichornis clamosus]